METLPASVEIGVFIRVITEFEKEPSTERIYPSSQQIHIYAWAPHWSLPFKISH
jgi:hypothetical protein